jgi:hypothetical protein
MDLENMQKRVIEGKEDTLSGFVAYVKGTEGQVVEEGIRKKDNIDNVSEGRMRKKAGEGELKLRAHMKVFLFIEK